MSLHIVSKRLAMLKGVMSLYNSYSHVYTYTPYAHTKQTVQFVNLHQIQLKSRVKLFVQSPLTQCLSMKCRLHI